MSQKNTIFVTVFGGVAEVDTTTVPENLEVEILDLDELEVDGDYIKKLSVEARKYAKIRAISKAASNFAIRLFASGAIFFQAFDQGFVARAGTLLL